MRRRRIADADARKRSPAFDKEERRKHDAREKTGSLVDLKRNVRMERRIGDDGKTRGTTRREAGSGGHWSV